MSRHIQITCPNCQRPDVRIRPEYLNRRVQCNYCDHVFRASLPPVDGNLPASAEIEGTAETDSDESHRLDDRRVGKTRSRYVRITCPNCQRSGMRIRPEYDGRSVQCKYCKHVFHATVPATSASPPTDAANERSAGSAAGLEAELKSLRGELASRTAEHASAILRLEEAETKQSALADQVRALQEQIDEAVAKARDEEALRRQVENAVAEQVASREEAARIAQAEIAALRAELQGHGEREAAHAKALQANEELERERDRFAAERDRLRDEVAAIRSEHETHVADVSPRLAQLEAERDSARTEQERLSDQAVQLKADRDQLQRELRSVRIELDGQAAEAARLGNSPAALEAFGADRDRLEAERQQAANLAEQSRSRLEELERSLAAALAGQEERRRSWELEQRQLQERWNVERQAERDREAAGRSALETEVHGLRQENATLVQEHQRSVETLRQELESERQGRTELDAARSESERDRDTLRAEVERLRVELGDARRQAETLTAQRDGLDRELAAAQARGAETSRHRDELDAQVQVLQTLLEKERQDREAEGQEHATLCDALRQERDAERRRNAALEAARAQAEEASKRLREQAEQLRAEYNRLQTQYADLTAKHQIAGREYQAERDRLTAALAHAGAQAPAAARGSEELDARLATLSLEVTAARAEHDTAQAPMATGKAAQADLQRRLAEATDEYLAWIARTERTESEGGAAADPHASQIESPPEPSVPASLRFSVAAPSSEDQEKPLEELRRGLRQARNAKGGFRSFLAAIGAHRHVSGKDPGQR